MKTHYTCPECDLTIDDGQPKGLCSGCALKGLAAQEPQALGSGSTLSNRSGIWSGKRLGDYVLVQEIARGGMGVVYQARQESQARTVALKLLLLGSHGAPESIRRFQLEASAAAGLKHPNIVDIYEVGVRDGEHFIAMEYIEGPNLAALARTRPLSPRQVANYLRTISLTIDYAHGRGILHRDLKPSNVIIDPMDQPRITDFGLAKRLTIPAVGDSASNTTRGGRTPDDAESLTVSGQVLGSPGFMPPEQARGARSKIDRRSDVYSLGAMLYYLLTGRAPFGGGSLSETLRQVESQEPVAPRLLNPGIPIDLETICLKCLEKDPDRRYQTASELGDEFDRYLKGERVAARPVGRVGKIHRWSKRNPMASAFLATVCSALLLTLWLLFLVNQEKNKQSILVDQVQRTVRANGLLLQRTLARIDENLEGIWANREKRFIDLDSEDVAMLGGEAKSFVTNKATAVRWRMGLITDEHPAHRIRQHAKFLSELETRSGSRLNREIRIDVRLYKFHEDFVQDLMSGAVDLGRMGAVRYLRAHRARPDLVPLAVPQTCYKIGLLFTRTNSGIQSLQDIIGRRVAFGETNSTISYWAQIRLAEQGITGEKLAGHEFLDSTLDFADEVIEVGFSNALQRIGYLHSHAQVIEGVMEGRFDVGVAMRRAFLIHQSRGLVAIPGSEFTSSRNVHVARAGLDPTFVTALTEAMTSLRGYWLEALPDHSPAYDPITPDLYRIEDSWLDGIAKAFSLPNRPPAR